MIDSWNTSSTDTDTEAKKIAITCQRITGSRATDAITASQRRELGGGAVGAGARRMTRDATRNTITAKPAGSSMARRQPRLERNTSVIGMAIGEASAPQMVSQMMRCIDRSGSRRTMIDWVMP